jgi:hypothetical protein
MNRIENQWRVIRLLLLKVPAESNNPWLCSSVATVTVTSTMIQKDCSESFPDI